MKTLKTTSKQDSFMEFVEHNGKKFRLKYLPSNGTPLGFDTRFCIQIMLNEGTWKTVGGKDDIDFTVRESYVSTFEEQAKESVLFFNACKNHIKLLY